MPPRRSRRIALVALALFGCMDPPSCLRTKHRKKHEESLPTIVVYRKNDCGHFNVTNAKDFCEQMVGWLGGWRMKFDTVNLTEHPEKTADVVSRCHEQTGKRCETFPLVEVNGKFYERSPALGVEMRKWAETVNPGKVRDILKVGNDPVPWDYRAH